MAAVLRPPPQHGDGRIAGLVASAPAALVSAILLPGASLQLLPSALAGDGAVPPAVATAIARQRQRQAAAVGPMPRPSFGLLGVTGGATPHIVVRLAERDATSADQAAKVMAYRLAHASSLVTMRPFAELLTLVSAAGQAAPAIAKAEFASTRPGYANLWLKMIATRDLGLVGWS